MANGCKRCSVLTVSLFGKKCADQSTAGGCVFKPGHYRRNQTVFFEGGNAQHLFALNAGLVKVVKYLENGKDRITGVLFPGEIFGLESLTDASYPLTAIALRDSEICAAPREEFSSYLRHNPEVAVGMVRFLVEELKRVQAQVTEMSFKDARMKVATLLLSLADTSAAEAAGPGADIILPVSRREISEILELSPETISRAFAFFRQEGMLTAHGRHIVIQNRPALESLAHR
jgi:CRP-like cAMP-binding protein